MFKVIVVTCFSLASHPDQCLLKIYDETFDNLHKCWAEAKFTKGYHEGEVLKIVQAQGREGMTGKIDAYCVEAE